MGSESLELQPIELEYREKAMKVVVAVRKIAEGRPVEASDVGLKRTPLEPGAVALTRLEDVVGRALKRTVQPHHAVTEDLLA
jgi:flagella basal body P-ring formation protein FlgA